MCSPIVSCARLSGTWDIGKGHEVEETSFADLRDIVRQLAQAQLRTEARVDELAQAQLRLDRGQVHQFSRKVAFYARKTGQQVARQVIVTPFTEKGARALAEELGIEICTDVPAFK
jgi:hypothetical protein